jgi:hypothetical protein
VAIFQLCSDLGFLHVHLEGDAKRVTDVVQALGVNCSRLGHVVDDIRGALQVFDNWRLTFVKKDGNVAAHRLAKIAILNGRDH